MEKKNLLRHAHFDHFKASWWKSFPNTVKCVARTATRTRITIMIVSDEWGTHNWSIFLTCKKTATVLNILKYNNFYILLQSFTAFHISPLPTDHVAIGFVDYVLLHFCESYSFRLFLRYSCFLLFFRLHVCNGSTVI